MEKRWKRKTPPQNCVPSLAAAWLASPPWASFDTTLYSHSRCLLHVQGIKFELAAAKTGGGAFVAGCFAGGLAGFAGSRPSFKLTGLRLSGRNDVGDLGGATEQGARTWLAHSRIEQVFPGILMLEVRSGSSCGVTAAYHYP